MKRIALAFFIGLLFTACNNPMVPDDDPEENPRKEAKSVNLKIHVPPRSISSYANEDASPLENSIDSIFIDLYEGISTTPIHRDTFGIADFDSHLDSLISVSYEVDNITTNVLRVEVFANRRKPLKLSQINSTEIQEVPVPRNSGANFRDTYFYMSGKANLTFNGTAYTGDVHIIRNVAKLRINVKKNPTIVIPSDLSIDYDNITVRILNATDSTTAFNGEPVTTGINYFNYPQVYANRRRGVSTLFHPVNGGLIDSLYLYENYRTSYTPATTTQLEIAIPTSSSEGNKTSTVTYSLQTSPTDFAVRRNYIYTLEVTVKAQNLDPLVSLEVLPWDDVHVDGSILGTYLHLNKTEIVFDSSGEAYIDFCSDAQAIYFDFATFNQNNATLQIGRELTPIGIDTSLMSLGGFPLAPTDFKDAQILLDKQHCGRFGFKLDLAKYPDPNNLNFSGSLCLRAGNIIQCLSFPARLVYDAHFIVGEPLLNGEQFISASSDVAWMEVSPQRLWTTAATQSWTGSSSPLFLHLGENLGTANRSGNVTLVNSNGASKKIFITQLPAIPVGRFGYSPAASTDDSLYNAGLYTEQLYEFTTMPIFGAVGALPNNALYNGRFPSIHASVFNTANYSLSGLNYHATPYPAINYCIYKNRPATKTASGVITASDIKWYLPSQAQLMAMWVSYESYRHFPYSNFYRNGQPADNFWSATANEGFSSHAQYMHFRYGNVGHFERSEKYWSRCVRDGDANATMLMRGTDNTGFEFPTIRFDAGMPPAVVTLVSKSSGSPQTNIQGDEASVVNQTLYSRLRVAKADMNNRALLPWSLNVCSTYAETDNGTLHPPVPPGGWRLPTQRELQAIWILQHDIKRLCPTFDLLGDNYYWSATDVSTAPTTSAWTVFGNGSRTLIGGAGNSPHQLKTTPLRVRCVAQYSLP